MDLDKVKFILKDDELSEYYRDTIDEMVSDELINEGIIEDREEPYGWAIVVYGLE